MGEDMLNRLAPVVPAEAERLLSAALERGGDYADVFFEHRVIIDYSREDGRVKTVGRGVALGVGVRVLRGDACGYAYAEGLDEERLLQAARTASQIAAAGRAAPPVAVVERPRASRYDVETPSVDAPIEDKLALLERADRAARACDPRVKRTEVTLTEELRHLIVATSDGTFQRDRQPLLRFACRAVVECGARRQSGGGGGGARDGLAYLETPGHTPEDYGRKAAGMALAMLDAREAPAGEMPVVLAAGDSGLLLHEAIGHGLEADFARKRTSKYTDQVGQRVASDACTIVDDPTPPRARGSLNVDDEGHAAARSMLIERGILRGYLHDRVSARHFGVGAGNGRRQSFRHVPLPRMTNTCLLAGGYAPEEIVASVPRGLLARRFSGGQVNISTGDFVFTVTEGYLIEGGRTTAPVRGVTLIGNGPEALRRVSMVGDDYCLSDGVWLCGKDGQWLPVGVGIPTIKIDSITVGGTQADSA
jgi:TldD protein